MKKVISLLMAVAVLVFVTGCSKSDPTPKGDGVYKVNGVTFKMVIVKGGSFMMGATEDECLWDDEVPAHKVTLSDFAIGETEVTQELWVAVMGENPSENKDEANLPVENVSWDDCQKFIAELNKLTGKKFRLPTEAEWEYAARGGNQSNGFKYSGSDYLSNVAWYNGNSGSKTHAVKGKMPNELGLYDMTGNVWEWCQDWFGAYSETSVKNPTGPAEGENRVYRGGGYTSPANYCRVLTRNADLPDFKMEIRGLRLAM